MLSIAELLEPIKTGEGDPSRKSEASSARFHAWIRSSASPELAAWNDAISGIEVRRGYHNALFAGTCPTLTEVLSVKEDGCRAARIRSVFLGASAILEDSEELWLATWGATPEAKSVVFQSHQDERDLWPAAPSIADFVVMQLRTDPRFAKELTLPAELASIPEQLGGAPLKGIFDPARLSPKLHWIVALLFPDGDWYGLGNGLVTASPFAHFRGELESGIFERGPHRLAYWLLHHLVFRNPGALASIVELGAASPYPAAQELAAMARPGATMPSWWNEHAIAELRAEALRSQPDVFEPATASTSA